MSKLDELIQQYCPDGVEYVPLSSIGTIKRGNGLQKKDFVKAGIGCIHYGQIYTKFGLFTNKTLTYVDKELADHLLHIEKGDLVIACTSENVEDVCKAVAWLGDDSIVTGGHSCVLHHNQNPKYIAYFFQTESFQRQKRKYAYGTKVIDIKPDSIGKIEIPLPPLPVQEEIVRILDAFTELQAELQAELQKRKQQYNYYLDNLLNFKNINRGGYQAEVRWMKMSEVFEIRNGYTPSKAKKEFWEGGTIPWFRMEDIRQNGRILSDSILHITPKGVKGKGLFKANSFILATTATIGEHALIIADSLANQQFTNLSIRKSLENELSVKYVYYYFFVIDEWCKANTNVSNFASVDMSKFYNLLIPIPSIAEQQRIVAILDRFDTLTTDLTQGLPAEIEKRRQQYEYYRDKLLTFKRKGA